MIIAVNQPDYIPWKGYFDIIHDADIFVYHTDLQYTKLDWRNRNKIKTPYGLKWLSIPVGQRHLDRLICEVAINDSSWQKKHYEALKLYYSKAPYFKKYNAFLEHVYLERKWDNLCDLDMFMTEYISKNFLGITTQFADSRDFASHGSKNEKLLSLLSVITLRQGGGKITYLSGPAAKDYIIQDMYSEQNIQVVWKNYDNYPEYPQLHGEFTHYVSILDLLFNTGNDAPYFIWGWREESGAASWSEE